MNLIEQLGGYEKTKEYLKENSCFMSFEALEGFYDALLEYRRQHNIFEAGDAIIRKWNGRLYWIIVNVDNGGEFLISQDQNAKFKDCNVCDMPCNFTHATPEEIKAGRRL